MKDFEILKLVDEDFRRRYESVESLDQMGFKNTKDNVSITYKDGQSTVTIGMKKKEALRLVYDSRRNAGQFKTVSFEDFESSYRDGHNIDEIEKIVTAEQLNFEGDKVEEKGE